MRGYISEDIPVLVIAIVQNYRRQGVGSVLIDTLKRLIKENDISKISLCVTKNNVAYHLYTKQGFKVVEEIDSSFNMLWEG